MRLTFSFLIAIIFYGVAISQTDPNSPTVRFPYDYPGVTSGYTQDDSTSNVVDLPQQNGDLVPSIQIVATENSGTASFVVYVEASLFDESGTQYWLEVDRDTLTSSGSVVSAPSDLSLGEGATDYRVTATMLVGADGNWTWNVYCNWTSRTSTQIHRKSRLPHFPYGSYEGLTSSVTQAAGVTNYINLPQQKGNVIPVIQTQATENSGTVTCTVTIQASYVDESGTQTWFDVDNNAHSSSTNTIYTVTDLASGKYATDYRIKVVTSAGTGNWTVASAVKWVVRN